MHILTITDPDGTAVVSLHIGEVADPSAATIAILTALAGLPIARKPRADRGKKRRPQVEAQK